MAFEPAAGERALGHDGQTLGRRAIDRGAHEPTAEAVALECVGHLGVDEHQPRTGTVVHELGAMTVDLGLEA
jgi:hypothetical protein